MCEKYLALPGPSALAANVFETTEPWQPTTSTFVPTTFVFQAKKNNSANFESLVRVCVNAP